MLLIVRSMKSTVTHALRQILDRLILTADDATIPKPLRLMTVSLMKPSDLIAGLLL
jgi:hypothetical protein